MTSPHFVSTSLRAASTLLRAVSGMSGCSGLILLSAVSANAEPKIEKDAAPANPGILSYTVTSDYQQGPNALEVLLPDKIEPGVRYPVIYTLPVNTGTKGTWGSAIVELQKLNVHNRYGVIIVAPAYDVDPWFGDTPKPADPAKPWIRQSSYLTDVVIPFVDKTFPTRAERDGRFLIGFSKSGLGAFGLILKNPDTFAKAAIYDCADPLPPAKIFNEWGMANTYGTLANMDENWNVIRLIQSEPARKAFAGPARRIILLAGNLHYGGVEMIQIALGDKTPYEFHAFPGMGHAWSAGWLSTAANSLLTPKP